MVMQSCHPWEWFSEPANPEQPGTLADIVENAAKHLRHLHDNALKVSGHWPHGYNEEALGCVPPPSKWPLDHVPPHIIDSIVDWVSYEGKHHHHKHSRNCGCRGTKLFSIERPVYPFFPFVETFKYLSMVNKEFRDSIFTRKIVPILYFGLTFGLTYMGNPNDINLTLSHKYRKYTTQIVLLRCEPKSPKEARDLKENRDRWAEDRNKFLGSLPNLDCLWDASMEVAVQPTALPSKMFNVTLFIRRGAYPTCPLSVTELRMLQIKACASGAEESHDTPEPGRWPEKIRVLTANIKKISNLQLSLPGLMTTGHSYQPRLEAGLDLPDPIPSSLPMLQVLALDVPFCSPTPGNYREAHWWGYLGWLETTRARFKTLQITMIWTMEFMPMRNPDTRDISTAMGVDLEPSTRFAWEEILRRNMPDYMLEITMQQFILTIFMKHPELDFFQIVYKSNILSGEPELYRIVIAERSEWGGVNIKDNLTGHWPLSLQIATQDIAEGFEPKNSHYRSKRHQDQPGVARFTAEMNPLGHTGHSFMQVGRMFGLDKETAPPPKFPTVTSAQLAHITDLAADCRQEGTGKSLATLDAVVSIVSERQELHELGRL